MIGILWNLSLPHISWGLWKDINNRVFRDIESNSLVVAIRIRNTIKENFLIYCPGRKNNPPLESSQEEWDTIKQWQICWNISIPIYKIKHTKHNVSWNPPLPGRIKI